MGEKRLWLNMPKSSPSYSRTHVLLPVLLSKKVIRRNADCHDIVRHGETPESHRIRAGDCRLQATGECAPLAMTAGLAWKERMASMDSRLIRSHKCRPCPNRAQEAALPDMSGHVRDPCNAGLQQRIEAWRRQGVSLRCTDQANGLKARAQRNSPVERDEGLESAKAKADMKLTTDALSVRSFGVPLDDLSGMALNQLRLPDRAKACRPWWPRQTRHGNGPSSRTE